MASHNEPDFQQSDVLYPNIYSHTGIKWRVSIEERVMFYAHGFADSGKNGCPEGKNFGCRASRYSNK